VETTFTGVFERIGDWYVGYAEELPGANAQGRTLDEARASLREAIELILQVNRDLARQEHSGRDVIREGITVSIA
jgi:predicted RNase H-like HicB family nuclease